MMTWSNPDVNDHDVRFKEVGEAYSVLGDPAKRALYDQGRLSQAIQAQYSASAAAAAAVHAKVKFHTFLVKNNMFLSLLTL